MVVYLCTSYCNFLLFVRCMLQNFKDLIILWWLKIKENLPKSKTTGSIWCMTYLLVVLLLHLLFSYLLSILDRCLFLSSFIYIYKIHIIFIYIILSDHMHTQFAQISQKQDGCNIYAIMKIMCPTSNHQGDFRVGFLRKKCSEKNTAKLQGNIDA